MIRLRLPIRTVFALVVLSACASPKEVARVVERPPVSTELLVVSGAADTATDAPHGSFEIGRFDGGKMWTFDNPPLDWFEEAYGLRPDSAWFRRARLGALRFGSSCSASFVSPYGLVMTNHHCARESVTKVSLSGEDLLRDGFSARTLADERRVEDLYVEQLVEIADVTERVHAAGRVVRGDTERVRARGDKADDIERQMTQTAATTDSTLRVEVIELYDGGRFAAYTYRRFEDVRLVMAPEKRLGYFGGDPDNFTYPRYALDMSFFRVFDGAGMPLETPEYFRWSTEGSREGDPVFVVGNPGSTSRSRTIAWLEFERDFAVPQSIKALESRAGILEDYLAGVDDPTVTNAWFSLRNSIKALTGEHGGLGNPELMARRRAAEFKLMSDIAADDSLQDEYGDIFQALEELQTSKRSEVRRSAAFRLFGTEAGSRVLTRALYGYYYDTLKRRGFSSPEELSEIRDDAVAHEDFPADVEKRLVALRLSEVRDALGVDDPTFRKIVGERSVEEVAVQLVDSTALMDTTRFGKLLDGSYLSSGDISVVLIDALAPLYFTTAGQLQSFNDREDLLNGRLAQARFELYGTATPPDASFSLRIADGVVQGYAYNGTVAPSHTTFYGLYDHYHSYFGVSTEWDLPDRWRSPPPSFELSTPLNLVSTNDITGGNSGSPLLNRDLHVVGLIFDGNIESLPNTFLFDDSVARAVSVDSRGILATLSEIYDLDRIALELTGHGMFETEEEADESQR